jgi:hypothetical protein
MTDDQEHGHEHDGVEHTHAQAFGPQPVPMSFTTDKVLLNDGVEKVMTTFHSVNGSWTVFFDKDAAITYAQTLLGYAYSPPLEAPEPVELTEQDQVDLAALAEPDADVEDVVAGE